MSVGRQLWLYTRYEFHFGKGLYNWKHKEVSELINPTISITLDVDYKEIEEYMCMEGVPVFICDILFKSTESEVRNVNLKAYGKVCIPECWIIDWRKREVEIYITELDGKGSKSFHFLRKITEANKDDLKFTVFPKVKITYDELFDPGYYYEDGECCSCCGRSVNKEKIKELVLKDRNGENLWMYSK